MKINRFSILVVLILCFVTSIQAQRRRKGRVRIQNYISITGGVSITDIITDNFETTSGNGFHGALLASVDLPHKFYNVSFGISFSENKLGISGRPLLISTTETDIDYKFITAQLNAIMHIKIFPKHLSIDVGPVLQYNGNLEFENQNQENFFINNYAALQAQDITKISQFNVNGAIGLSLGIKHFKLTGKYLYGFTNILGKLNSENLNTLGGSSDFKGNQSTILLGATVLF